MLIIKSSLSIFDIFQILYEYLTRNIVLNCQAFYAQATFFSYIIIEYIKNKLKKRKFKMCKSSTKSHKRF